MRVIEAVLCLQIIGKQNMRPRWCRIALLVICYKYVNPLGSSYEVYRESKLFAWFLYAKSFMMLTRHLCLL